MTKSDKKPIVVEVGMATVQMRPVGFVLYAEEFLIAGASIPEQSNARGNTKFTPVPFYLLARSLELVLKSYLLTVGFSEVDLAKRKYGHNLDILWHQANDSGIAAVLGDIPTYFVEDLMALNSYYTSKHFEYFDFHRWAHGYKDLPPLQRLIDELKNVVERTKKHVLAVS